MLLKFELVRMVFNFNYESYFFNQFIVDINGNFILFILYLKLIKLPQAQSFSEDLLSSELVSP